jgi:hypothetical protein
VGLAELSSRENRGATPESTGVGGNLTPQETTKNAANIKKIIFITNPPNPIRAQGI